MSDPEQPDLWGLVPISLWPYPDDLTILSMCIDEFAEGCKLRRDFQNAASAEAGERRLHQPAPQSGFAMYGRKSPSTKDIAVQYQIVSSAIKKQLLLLQNKAVMAFMLRNLHVIMPDIGFSETDKPRRVLKGDDTLVEKALMTGRADMLIVILYMKIDLGGSGEKAEQTSY